MSGLDRKRKLDAVKKSIPSEIRKILEDTIPAVEPGEDPVADTWEKGLARVAAEMKKVEDSKVVVTALKRRERAQGRHDVPSKRKDDTQQHPSPGRHSKWKGPSKTAPFKGRKPFRKKWSVPFQGKSEAQRNGNRDGEQPKGDNTPKAGRPLAEVKCFRCGKMGHYANKCTQPPEGKGNGGGRGGGKTARPAGRGRGGGRG